MNNNTSLEAKTRIHYDKYPFVEGGEKRIKSWQEYLTEFLPNEDVKDKLIADIGSSIGEISKGLIKRGARLACLDISYESLKRCRQINPEAMIFHGNALKLPFASNSFDHAISIGVLHHTPSCRQGFREISRITSPGGSIVLFIFNYWSIYNLIYYLFKPFAKLIPLDRVPDCMSYLLQPFVMAHMKRKLDKEQLRRLLADKLWTPQATFHTAKQIKKWGVEEGLTFVRLKKFYLSYANIFLFKKGDSASNQQRKEPELKCIKCGNVPMKKIDIGYGCTKCDYQIKYKYGIYRTIGVGEFNIQEK